MEVDHTRKSKRIRIMDSVGQTSSTSSTIKNIDNFLNNTFTTTKTELYLPVENPACSESFAQVTLSSSSDVDQAVEYATQSFNGWSNRTMKSRATMMEEFQRLVEKHALELAKLIVLENGKNINEALAEVAKGNETVAYACSLPCVAQGKTLQVSTDVWCSDRRDPLGVVGSIVPFNFPFMVPMWTVPIALVLGNCVILKPSEKVPVTMNRVAQLFKEAGFPPGVFQIVNGTQEAAKSLIVHPNVSAISFVGSSPVAKSIHASCSSMQKRVLALGGAKNHLVALSDCHIPSAATDIVASFAGCAGQRCMAASVLLLVKQNNELMDLIINKASQIKFGQNAGEMGPLIDSISYQKVCKYIKSSEELGSKILLDGRTWSNNIQNRKNNWIGPTILLHKKPTIPAMTEEIFGPVLSVYICSSWEEALKIQNSSPFGNAASIYTNVGSHADYFIKRFKGAMLGVNIGIPVPREPFSFGGLYGTVSKYGDFDITGDGAIEFFTNRIKVTSRWPKIDLPLTDKVVATDSNGIQDKASFVGQM